MSDLDTPDDIYIVPYNTNFSRRIGLLGLGIFVVGIGLAVAMLGFVWSTTSVAVGHVRLRSVIEHSAPAVVILVAEVVILSIVLVRHIRPRKHPIVTLRPHGIEIHSQYVDIGLLPWSEIESIQKFKFNSWQVGIVPRDIDSLLQQLAPRQQKVMVSLIRFADRLKARGRFISPINIPELYMHITADQLIDHIRAFQLRYHPTGPLAGDEPNADVTAWPPAPGVRIG